MLRGEDVDLVSREYGVTASRLSSWRDDFISGGQANLKSRGPTPEGEEVDRLKGLVGDLTMRLELSREKIRRMESGVPPGSRRSSR